MEIQMKRRGILVVVSGFSGAGKGTLMKKLIQTYEQYALSVSMTTRAPREGEENGREYFSYRKRNLRKRSVRTVWWNMPAIAAIITGHRNNMWRRSWQQGKM